MRGVFLVGLFALGQTWSCGNSETSEQLATSALDIQLVLDPNLNSVADLRARVHQLELVVDHPNGTYPSGSDREVDDISVSDVDGDGSLELMATVDLPANELPEIRLERGSLPADSLEIRIRGLSTDGSVAAFGTVRGASFPAKGAEALTVSFNLVEELLPPRVIWTQPGEGGEVESCEPGGIVIAFSKHIDPSTAQGAECIAVEWLSPDGTVQVPVGDRVIRGRILQLLLPATIGAGDFQITVCTDIADLQGQRLDQFALEPGLNPFVSRFISNPPRQDFCPVGGRAWCWSPDSSATDCPDGDVELTCVDQICQPSGCGPGCDDGLVCDPAAAQCKLDCRSFGANAGCLDGYSCQSDSGLCVQG